MIGGKYDFRLAYSTGDCGVGPWVDWECPGKRLAVFSWVIPYPPINFSVFYGCSFQADRVGVIW